MASKTALAMRVQAAATSPAAATGFLFFGCGLRKVLICLPRRFLPIVLDRNLIAGGVAQI